MPAIVNPFKSSDTSFFLPNNIASNARDEYGQVDEYSVSLYNGYTINGTNLYETDDSNRLIFNQNVRDLLEFRFMRANHVRIIEKRVKELKDEPDPEADADIKKKKNLLKGLEKARTVAATESEGIAIDTLDTSMALLFGNKTTVGQVCGYSKGLEISGTALDGVHGFCCGDAPYQNDYWGELVSPTYVYPPHILYICANCYVRIFHVLHVFFLRRPGVHSILAPIRAVRRRAKERTQLRTKTCARILLLGGLASTWQRVTRIPVPGVLTPGPAHD